MQDAAPSIAARLLREDFLRLPPADLLLPNLPPAPFAEHLAGLVAGATDEQLLPTSAFCMRLLSFASVLDARSDAHVQRAIRQRYARMIDTAQLTPEHLLVHFPNYKSKHVEYQIAAEKTRLTTIYEALSLRQSELLRNIPTNGAAPPADVAAFVQNTRMLDMAAASMIRLYASLATCGADMLGRLAMKQPDLAAVQETARAGKCLRTRVLVSAIAERPAKRRRADDDPLDARPAKRHAALGAPAGGRA